MPLLDVTPKIPSQPIRQDEFGDHEVERLGLKQGQSSRHLVAEAAHELFEHFLFVIVNQGVERG